MTAKKACTHTNLVWAHNDRRWWCKDCSKTIEGLAAPKNARPPVDTSAGFTAADLIAQAKAAMNRG